MASPQEMSPRLLRIVDANLNRIGEGLRLLEDIARLLLDDASLSAELKGMRHQLVGGEVGVQEQLVSARNAAEDVGSNLEVPGEGHRRDLPALVMANSRRVQESLRVLEEMAKLPTLAPPLDQARFKQSRFRLYELEQRLLSKVLRHDKLERVEGLYVIIDSQALKGRSQAEVTRQALRGGARVIQLRDKQHSRRELLPIAQEMKKLCAQCQALFIVNDYLDLALAVDADGLHIGQSDLPLPAVRRELPIDKIVGCSTATLAQALQAQSEGADYIAVGPIYPTPSKETPSLAGLDTLRRINQEVSLPLVAIGGINKDNMAPVLAAGANAVAVISAVLGAQDAETASRELAARIEAERKDQGGQNKG